MVNYVMIFYLLWSKNDVTVVKIKLTHIKNLELWEPKFFSDSLYNDAKLKLIIAFFAFVLINSVLTDR